MSWSIRTGDLRRSKTTYRKVHLQKNKFGDARFCLMSRE